MKCRGKKLTIKEVLTFFSELPSGTDSDASDVTSDVHHEPHRGRR